jgi:hypothetical protein
LLVSSSIPSRAGDSNVGVFFPRHSGDPTSDTPVAISRLHPQRFIELPRCCLLLCLRPPLAFLRVRRDRRMWRPPSPSSAPSLESRYFVLDWDAFYRQGPFVGSSGHYSPGPATRSPLLAMVEPLSDTLASPWVFIRTSPICIGVETGSSTSFHSPYPPAGSTYERSLRARSPFTRPCRSFCCANAELIRDQMPPDDFCNCYRCASNQTNGSRSSQGRWPRPPSFSYASRRSSLSSDTRRAALASASADPGASSSQLPRFA